jgi:hypothetical protein
MQVIDLYSTNALTVSSIALPSPTVNFYDSCPSLPYREDILAPTLPRAMVG